MKYMSTRGGGRSLSAAEAIIAGIAEDGGLFVPEKIPSIDRSFVEELLPLTYADRAKKVLGLFLEDYTMEEIDQCVESAYGENKFDTEAIAPVISLPDGSNVLELWHGPTSAFKDMALQLLPQLMSTALKKTGEESQVVILVATSGDTGKAALEGFKDVAQIRIMVFYPQGGVSEIQRRQMVSQTGKNVSVIAVKGNFDDAQTGVKNIFNDQEYNMQLSKKGIRLSSANSINWGRLVPQIVYYFSAYADLVQKGSIALGDQVNFSVPTGNFGNILAAYYARKMGLPIHKLICASNANHVLTDFLQTGIYNRNRSFYKTISPSMDILISSNLERLLYHVSGKNQEKVCAWMKELNEVGCYQVDAECLQQIKDLFWADWSDDEETAIAIRNLYETGRYISDTHTAVAWRAAQKYRAISGDKTEMVVVSTASPYKFNQSVLTALGKSGLSFEDEFVLLEALHDISHLPIPKGLKNLKNAEVLHKQECFKEDLPKVVWTLL